MGRRSSRHSGRSPGISAGIRATAGPIRAGFTDSAAPVDVRGRPVDVPPRRAPGYAWRGRRPWSLWSGVAPAGRPRARCGGPHGAGRISGSIGRPAGPDGATGCRWPRSCRSRSPTRPGSPPPKGRAFYACPMRARPGITRGRSGSSPPKPAPSRRACASRRADPAWQCRAA